MPPRISCHYVTCLPKESPRKTIQICRLFLFLFFITEFVDVLNIHCIIFMFLSMQHNQSNYAHDNIVIVAFIGCQYWSDFYGPLASCCLHCLLIVFVWRIFNTKLSESFCIVKWHGRALSFLLFGYPDFVEYVSFSQLRWIWGRRMTSFIADMCKIINS